MEAREPLSRNILIAAALFGAAAGLFFRGVFDAAESRTAVNFLLSSTNGAILASSMVAAHLWLVRHGSDWLRRQSLAVELLVDGGVMVATGVVAQAVAQHLLYGTNLDELPALIPSRMSFALAMMLVFLAVAHVVRLIGARQVMSVLAGRYRRPVEEMRVFLFADLKDATGLAERFGPVRVAALLARFFHDVDDTIAAHGGDVHAYIGDEVIVTWPLQASLRDAACLRCAFAMRDRITALGDSYAHEFGIVPEFRTVLHCGPVVVNEIGRTRQQIGYFGDTVNVAARLEEYAKRVQRDVLISRDLLDRLDLLPDVVAEDLGEVALRGREAPVHVLALSRATDAPAEVARA
jgi:adenylate cyclase